MKKAKKYFLFVTVICCIGVLSASAALYQSFSKNLTILGLWSELPYTIKETTTDYSDVSLSDLGGARAVNFKARGQWYDHTDWHWTNYGPTATATVTGSITPVYFNQSFSKSMRVALSMRNVDSNLSSPKVVGVWNHR